MISDEFPLVLSPNLGCPRIVELANGDVTIPLIVAGQYGDGAIPNKELFQGLFRLVPSYEGEGREADLVIQEDPLMLSDWNQLPHFENCEDTQMLISGELHNKVLGEGTSYWKVNATMQVDNPDGFLRKRELCGEIRELPTLYDLVITERSGRYRRINYHAVQLVNEIKKGDCNFLHITDMHVAKRNDQMLAEVLKVKNERTKEVIQRKYINFNHNLRRAIRKANDMADNGEINFVLFTGDLVDFSFHGWELEVNRDENNFKEFIDILVGRGHELRSWQNPGLKIALFTSTGNHDWRLHPYNPGSISKEKAFGLTESEVKNYPYRSYDSSDYPEDRRARLARELAAGMIEKFNFKTFNRRDKWKLRLGKITRVIDSSNFLRALLAVVIPGVGVSSLIAYAQLDPAPFQVELTLPSRYIPIIAIVVSILLEYVARRFTNWLANHLVANPLIAEAKAIHYYFTHINPYLDYAFSYGDNHFILMDTGCDLFVGDLLDEKQVKHLKRASIRDNIIGGSPDSRAFDSELLYYPWSQIVWLEKVLQAKSINKGDNVFISLHSPPVNVPSVLYRKLESWKKVFYWLNKLIHPSRIYHEITSWDDIRESNQDKKIKNKWISKKELDLTYGTINHYVSQFFYLCMGLTEAEHRKQKELPKPNKKVTMVFCGHAHRNIEFSIGIDWNNHKKENEIRIFSDLYSDCFLELNKNSPNWKKRPLIIQTAACGPPGEEDITPPYYRKVVIQDGKIKGAEVKSVKGDNRAEIA